MFNKQGEQLFSKMMNESNSDGSYLSYQFNGEISVIKNLQSVKLNLNLEQGCLPTKEIPGKIETDEHHAFWYGFIFK